MPIERNMRFNLIAAGGSLVFILAGIGVPLLLDKVYSDKQERIVQTIQAERDIEATRLASITPTITYTPTITLTPTLTSTATMVPTPTEIPIGPDNNPFVNAQGYDANNSFSYLEDRVEGLKGTVADSYIDYMSVWVGNSDGGGQLRPFSWLILKDRVDPGKYYYLIYPADRLFQKGAKVDIEAYWPLAEGTILMNHMLVNLTNITPDDSLKNYTVMDFPIQSSAPDGHIDGIIQFNGVEYLASGDMSLPTATPSPTPGGEN